MKVGAREDATACTPDARALPGTLECAAFLPYSGREMPMLRLLVLPLFLALSLYAQSATEQKLADAIKSPQTTVVHLWAPWCSNCQAELKTGGWTKMINENPQVRFYFVSIWNDGQDGRAMLNKFGIAAQPNVTILADPGPRRGENKIKQLVGLPLSWIPTTWIYKGGDLRYALNYGEVRFPVLQQFLTDSQSEWSHKGEPSLE
ncbi:MAG: TlpA family protein disulfide reductase [Candidatus Udaeobacter sp.]